MRPATLLFIALAGTAAAEDFEFPNPLRLQNLAATCAQMTAQIRANDPRAVQALVGVWEGVVPVPGAPGFYPPTQGQYRTMNNPDGTYVSQTYACLQPQGFDPFCNTSQISGEWAAHFTPDGLIAVPASSSGIGLAGGVLPISCGISFWRQIDPNTLQGQDGTILRRVR